MTKTAEDAQTSHGKHSNLWKALNTRLIEEAALVDYPRAVITWMMTVQFQDVANCYTFRLILAYRNICPNPYRYLHEWFVGRRSFSIR
jgi:hypothetical protein